MNQLFLRERIAKMLLVVSIASIIEACHSTKQIATPTSSSTNNFVFVKPDDGIHDPGTQELTAIRVKYSDVTMETLKEGHFIYTQGACINCHNAENIYVRGETQWKDIIENMAQKANISDAQKDAVYKYVLSIKATQPQ
jgi:hypothetical protein